MESIRLGMFETNSSSCHAFTLIRRSDWNAFMKGEIYIRKDSCADIHIHETIIDKLDDEDEQSYYFVKPDDYFKEVLDCVESYFAHDSSPYSYRSGPRSNFEGIVDRYIRKNLSIDLLKKALLGDGEEVLEKLEKPCYIDYSEYFHDYKIHRDKVESIKVCDVFDRIFGDGKGRFEFTDVYIFGDSYWNPEECKVKTFISEDKDSDLVIIQREIQDP
jgi:hypothetical protein